jgi:G6PDH family F420-dependent oxidoreductase
MTAWGLHCAHELHAPSALLQQAIAAQAAGFDTVACSDPFRPWLPSPGSGGFSWSWLGAVMERTHLPVGVVTTPGQRQHPALVAQAAATLAQMYPSRLWVALGTGESLHESVTGDPWPAAEARTLRLEACAELLRRLLAGESVTYEGAGVRVQGARLHTLPSTPVPLLAAAFDAEAAGRCATWADGMVTVRREPEELQRIVDSYRRRGGRGPLILQAPHGWGRTDAEARALVHRQWPVAALPHEQLAELATPEAVAVACGGLTADDVAARVPVSSDLEDHRSWMEQYEEIGFDAVYVMPLGAPPRELIDAYGREVLPRLR